MSTKKCSKGAELSKCIEEKVESQVFRELRWLEEEESDSERLVGELISKLKSVLRDPDVPMEISDSGKEALLVPLAEELSNVRCNMHENVTERLRFILERIEL